MSVKPNRSCVACYTYDDSKKGTIATPCCSRFVCGSCARQKPRLAETCILCQLPIPRDLTHSTLEDLPGYDDALPTYDSFSPHDTKSYPDEKQGRDEKGAQRLEGHEREEGYKEAGVQHFIRKEDSIASLALAYRVPPQKIRSANHIFADNLLQGRSFVVIPGATKSLSASPGEDEIEKVKLKKFMVAVKCTDYDMAKSKKNLGEMCETELTSAAYMRECDYRLADAVERYNADSQWTRAHAKETQAAGPSRQK